MKLLNTLIMAGLLAAAGCIPDSFVSKDKQADKSAKEEAQPMGRPHNYITPDQVDEKNFRDKEKLLRRELEMDEQDAARAAVPAKQ
jgi:hypothetical protein